MTEREKEIYEAYKDRLSAPMYLIRVSKEKEDAYNKENPLPSEEDIQRILREAGY